MAPIKKDKDKGTTDANDTGTPPVIQTPSTPPQSPFSDAPKDNSYVGQGSGTAGSDIDIPEPIFQGPPPEAVEPPNAEDSKNKGKEEKEKKPIGGNLGLAGESEKTKQEGAAVLAETIIQVWEKVYMGANQLLKIPEKKIKQLTEKGEIDTRLEVPYKNQSVPLQVVINDYNKDADNVLVLEDEFKQTIHPLMTEELAKAGHGLSNLQQLGVLIAMKLGNDGIKVWQFINLKKEWFSFARDVMKNNREIEIIRNRERIQAEQSGNTNTQHVPVHGDQQTGKVVDMNAGNHDAGGNGDVGNNEDYDDPNMTLQERALRKLDPHNFRNANRNSLSDMNKAMNRRTGNAKPGKSGKMVAKTYIKSAETAVREQDDVPRAKVKGQRGRPKGAKNKRKK